MDLIKRELIVKQTLNITQGLAVYFLREEINTEKYPEAEKGNPFHAAKWLKLVIEAAMFKGIDKMKICEKYGEFCKDNKLAQDYLSKLPLDFEEIEKSTTIRSDWPELKANANNNWLKF